MRLAALFSLLLLTPATVFVHEANVTAVGMSEEFAIDEQNSRPPGVGYWHALWYGGAEIQSVTG